MRHLYAHNRTGTERYHACCLQGGGKIGEWGEYEQHISGDIVQAARQYWYATADKDWLEEIGFPLAKGVAEFYAKRVTPRAYTVTTQGSAPVYDMNDVMGPDEYAFPVNNSAYTNAAAAIALNFATEAAGVLGKPADPSWATVAEGLALKISDDIPLHPELKGGYHPECTSRLCRRSLPCFSGIHCVVLTRMARTLWFAKQMMAFQRILRRPELSKRTQFYSAIHSAST